MTRFDRPFIKAPGRLPLLWQALLLSILRYAALPWVAGYLFWTIISVRRDNPPPARCGV